MNMYKICNYQYTCMGEITTRLEIAQIKILGLEQNTYIWTWLEILEL